MTIDTLSFTLTQICSCFFLEQVLMLIICYSLRVYILLQSILLMNIIYQDIEYAYNDLLFH